MTTVNVTTQKPTVTVTHEGTSTVVEIRKTNVVTALTAGPQGPAGVGFDIDTSAKVDKSLVYYDAALGHFVANDTWTVSTIVKGGDF